LAEEIERAGGTIEKFTADAVIAACGHRPRLQTTRSGRVL
jgi:class 3 adenylate cyclase